MFIVFGMPRSGTTLLAATLHQHEQIVVPDETDFIVPAAFIIDRIKDPEVGRPMIASMISGSARFPFSIGKYLTEEDVAHSVNASDYSLPDILKGVYALVASKARKRIAGDKSPNDLNFVRILIKTGLAESDIRIIHLVRDVRDVVMSLKNVTWAPSDVEEFLPRYWSSTNLYLHGVLKDRPDRYLFLRYEDLVSDPEKHVTNICSFLEVPFQPQMLDHAHRGDRYKELDHHQNVGQPYQTDHVGTWRQTMDADLRLRCETQAAEGLREFGYALDR